MKKPPQYNAIGRVDLAGERGACALYAGHIFGLALRGKKTSVFEHFCEEELSHVDFFQRFCQFYSIKPTKFDRLFRAVGWSGAVVAGLLGPQTCFMWTQAVESVIEKHYVDQAKSLAAQDPLAPWLAQFAQEEASHRLSSMHNRFTPRQKVFMRVLSSCIRVSIFLSRK